jgi:tetratricopeptide (TPR) repeat protein
VSAVSAPKPDEPAAPGSDADGWALLESLRRKLEDQAALGRKTQAQVAQLAESIAALVAQQRRRSVWLNVNSFVAYVVFTILCAAGCYLLYLSRANELGAARERAVAERDAAVRRADELTARAAARDAAEGKAWEAYQLLDAGKRADATTGLERRSRDDQDDRREREVLEALRDQPLSRTERAVLAARVDETRAGEVDAAIKAAAAAIKAGRPAEFPNQVIKPLEAALAGEPAGARAATLHYYLGVAYARTQLDKAIAHLQQAVAGEVDQADVRFQLASVLDRSGAFALARAEYDRFATAHPQSPLALFAMRRSATLARFAVMPPAQVPAAGAAGAPRPWPRPPAKLGAPPRAPARPAPSSEPGDPGARAPSEPTAPAAGPSADPPAR